MKMKVLFIIIIVLVIPVSDIASSQDRGQGEKTGLSTAGDLIALTCSNPYPTLGQPVYLIVTIQGNALERFNQTIVITDEFSGLVTTNGEMTEVFGNVTIRHMNITIGKLPRYTKRIAWYPSIVGNHTFYAIAGSSSKKQLNVSVGFDVEGIITPSLGCPVIIARNTTSTLSVTLSQERGRTEEPAQILELGLHCIHSTTSYVLENRTGSWSVWVDVSPEVVEDEQTVSYDISSIPDGFYNISVVTTKQNYSWPHAVRLLDTEPKDFNVVQLTDVHIGKYSNPVNKKKELIRLLTYLNEHIHPDFVILSGDLVDWYNKKSKRNAYAELQEALLHADVPVFTTPGNHERYGNSLLFLYIPYTNLTPYHRFLNPLNDYALRYGNVTFIFLDSGYEYSRWEITPQILSPTPEASGLTAAQIYLLEQVWGTTQMNQVITMHHPAVNDKNDSGICAVPNDLPSGNNECIAFNRGEFISYCIEKNVSLVLTGHTHRNRVFNYLGKEPQHPLAWPLFIQTDSATLNRGNNGGRVINIKNGTILDYEYVAFV